MLSISDSANSWSFWKPNATCFMSSDSGMARTSAPPISTDPDCGSQNRGTRLAAVVLPEPEGPTSATVEPCGTVKLKWLSAGCSAPS